jgi:hypothetical protein
MSLFHHFSKDNVSTISQVQFPGIPPSVGRSQSNKKFLTIPSLESSNNKPFLQTEENSKTEVTRDSKSKVKVKGNNTRTNLLVLVSRELTENKKSSKTKINSKTLPDAEKEYNSQNSQYVNLKVNIYSPRCNMGEGTQQKHGGVILSCDSNSPWEKSPLSKYSGMNISMLDISAVNSSHYEDSLGNSPKRLKTSVAGKKINFFRMSTLAKIENIEEEGSNMSKSENLLNNIENSKYENLNTKNKAGSNKLMTNTVDENLELINVDHGFIKNKNTLKRTEKGFKYLRSLARKFKKPVKKRHFKVDKEPNFEAMKEILCLKENIELDSLNASPCANNNNLSTHNYSHLQNNLMNNNLIIPNRISSIKGVLNKNKILSIPSLVIIPSDNLNSSEFKYNHSHNQEKGNGNINVNGKIKSNFSHTSNSSISSRNNSCDIEIIKDCLKNLDPFEKSHSKRDLNTAISLSLKFKHEEKKLNNSFNHSDRDSQDFFIKLYECSKSKLQLK